jgi:hypothetical protein
MADEAESLVLQHLRAIRGENDKTHRLLSDLTLRVGSLEQKVAFIGADIARIDTRLTVSRRALTGSKSGLA